MKMIFTKIVSALFAPATIFILSQAHADEKRCPEWATPDKPILKHRFRSHRGHQFYGKGPPFDAPSYFWKRGVWFEMPLGYRSDWSTNTTSWKLIDKEKYKELLSNGGSSGYDSNTGEFNSELVTKGSFGVRFAFWMPSLRYVERNLFFTPYYRPCEAGRLPPTQSEYIVKFRIDWPFLPNAEASSPARRFRYFAKRLSEGKKLPMQNSKRYEHNWDSPISGYAPYSLFYDDRDLAVHLSCSAYLGPEKPPQPLCHGKAMKRSLSLILYLRFPSEKGQKGSIPLWKPVVNAAIAYAVNWRS